MNKSLKHLEERQSKDIGCKVGSTEYNWFPDGIVHPNTDYLDISFGHVFDEPPVVMIAPTFMDLPNWANTRYRMRVENVTRQGFLLETSTWAGTKIYGREIHWMACPSV